MRLPYGKTILGTVAVPPATVVGVEDTESESRAVNWNTPLDICR